MNYSKELLKNIFSFKKDEFVYGQKRKNISKNIFVTLFAIFLSLIISLFIAMAVYGKGSLFYEIIAQIFISPFNSSNWKLTLGTISIFSISALSFVFASRAGMFNIGISGQMLFAAQISIMLAWAMPNIPNGLGQILLILVGIIAGALLAMIVGALKIYFNINEVISSIMLNWIVYFVGTMILAKVGAMGADRIEDSGLYTESLKDNLAIIINTENAQLNGAWLPLLIITFIALCLSIMVLSFLTFGKKISCSGIGPNGSLYAGMNVKLNQLITMAISGGLAGLLGVMLYCGQNNALSVTIAAKTIPNEGFTGISIGLIAMNNPSAILPVSCLFGMIENSKSSIQQVCKVDPNITSLMFGIIIYGAAIVSLFFLFKPWILYKKLKYGKQSSVLYVTHLGDMQREIEEANTAIFYVKEAYKLTHKSMYYVKQINSIKKNIDPSQFALIQKFIKQHNDRFDHTDINEFLTANSNLNTKQINKYLLLVSKRIDNDQTLNEHLEMTQVKKVFLEYYVNTDKLVDKLYCNKAIQTIYELYKHNKLINQIAFLSRAKKKYYEDYRLKNLKTLTSDYNAKIFEKLNKIEENVYKKYLPLIKKSMPVDRKHLFSKYASYQSLTNKKSPDSFNATIISEVKKLAEKQKLENNKILTNESKNIEDCNLKIKKVLENKNIQSLTIKEQSFISEQNRQINLSNEKIRQYTDFQKQLQRIDQVIAFKQRYGYDLALSKSRETVAAFIIRKNSDKYRKIME